MITFNRSIDPHSLDIVRDSEDIGFLQWHPDRDPRIVLHKAGEQLSVWELQACMLKFEEVQRARNQTQSTQSGT